MDEHTADRLVADYLRALEAADLDGVLSLFSEGAAVHSPLYGRVPAHEFYPRLFGDTASSRLELRAVLTGQDAGGPVVAFWFDFHWILVDGTPAPFTVVDLARLDDEGKIQELHIVYDATAIRARFEAARTHE